MASGFVGFAEGELQALVADVASKALAEATPQLEALVTAVAGKLIAEVTAAIESKLGVSGA